MKALVLFTLLLAPAAQAEVLRCVSGADESIYFTSGSVLVLADTTARENLLLNTDLSLRPSSKLGARESRATGLSKNGYIRFPIGGDAWCSYRLALPVGYSRARGKVTGFVDAFCEENHNSSVKLSCYLR